MSDTDLELLARYIRDQAEDAFAELVHRHLDLVHSAALRQVRSPQLAEEIAQSTFLKLAREARRLASDTILTAWLYQVTRREAANVIRREVRRQLREQIATEMNTANVTTADWTNVEPLLDEAMHALDDNDRAAVLLRYFENKSLREVGESLGTSDDAAQKRVSRAVERLREFFAARGITIGTSRLAVVISANAVQTAPLGLAGMIATAAFAGTTAAATIATQSAITTMNWINAKSLAAIAASAVIAGTGTLLVQERRVGALEAELQNVLARQEALTHERDAAVAARDARAKEFAAIERERTELLRLRNEAGLLRKQTNDLATLRLENRQLAAALSEVVKALAKKEADPELEQRMHRPRVAKILTLPLLMYADDNHGQFPARFDLAAPYFREAYQADPFLRDEVEFAETTKQFEIVYHGTQDAVTNVNQTILIREKQARQRPDGKWEKAYGFTDGSGQGHVEADGNFEAWEKRLSATQAAGQSTGVVEKVGTPPRN